ncbi:MAG: Na+:solute symporter [Planctomycetes bacterium]|jgi:Na+/proline symporter|nr:Na+:solute symporter [Planctomycetota bacterium]
MHAVDLAIIILYFLLMIAVGWVVAKMAARNPESYFLAGKSLPWWLIGIAHGSSGVDISGTMWFVMVLFVYGVKGVWLLWVWPLFNVIFRMVYLGTWVRRSNVLTGAEWMRTRFGYGRGAELAYISIVAYAIVSVIPFLCLAFKGIGKFVDWFIPVELLGLSASALPWGMTSESFWAIIVMSVTGVYCVVGGMYSVVMNDLIQFTLIVVAAIVIGIVAITSTTPAQIAAAVPAGWDQMFFGWKLDLDWSTVNLPALNEKLYAPFGHGGDGYSLFGVFVLVLLFKGILVSMAGPTPNYAIQHVLSTRSPREAALENMMMAICSLAPRFLLIGGIAVLGIAFFGSDLQAITQGKMDREEILPRVVSGYVPIGCKGLILAGLLAAFMSTFVSTVNSGSAYVVNDIYKRYINPHAPAKQYVKLGYLCSVLLILLGIAFGLITDSVHSITQILVSAIVPAFVVPNVLKWHWWRFNGYGFFAGMVAGTGPALILLLLNKKEFMTSLGLAPLNLHPDYVIFPIIVGLSLLASVIVCLLTRPEKEDVLKSFYRTVRPWGFWRPIDEKCRAEQPDFQRNRNAVRDWFNVTIGIVWELAMVAAPIFLVLQQYGRMLLATAVFAVTSVILKFTWYDKIEPKESSIPRRGQAIGLAPGPTTP